MSELLSQVLATLAAILLGVAGIAGLFLGLDALVGLLPQRLQPKVRPWAYIGPALLVLSFYLVYPALHTLYLSFWTRNRSGSLGLGTISGRSLRPKCTLPSAIIFSGSS